MGVENVKGRCYQIMMRELVVRQDDGRRGMQKFDKEIRKEDGQ